MDLQDRVAIVTGSTRGIGKALALSLAEQGCNVTVTGKTDEPDPDLPGTIYQSAEEVEELGAEALPRKMDVRHDEEVESVVEDTVDEWGRLDILINNAGAIQMTPVEETPPKRFDLLMDVNARGAYVSSYYALPHMKETGGGHILMASPPVASDQSPGKTAYGLSKIGMTYVAKSLAAEVEDHDIGVNAFWPLTALDTRATRYFGLGSEEMWRTPEILCDTVMEIVDKDPAEFSGNAVLDEPFLREHGVEDFEKYNVVEGTDPPPLSAQLFGVDDPNDLPFD
ncbi:MAG: SDR family oxidoreductase [Bradymonadaceae bacterium]